MKVELANCVSPCPNGCADADLSAELVEAHRLDGRRYLIVAVDCDHSGVCKYKHSHEHEEEDDE